MAPLTKLFNRVLLLGAVNRAMRLLDPLRSIAANLSSLVTPGSSGSLNLPAILAALGLAPGADGSLNIAKILAALGLMPNTDNRDGEGEAERIPELRVVESDAPSGESEAVRGQILTPASR